MLFNSPTRLGLFAALVACTSVLAAVSGEDSIFASPIRFEKRSATVDAANPSIEARSFRRHHARHGKQGARNAQPPKQAAKSCQTKRAQGQKAGGQAAKNDNNPQTSLTLLSQLVQTASSLNLANLTNDESEPDHSTNNFINFCVDQTLTNGTQNQNGSCNPVPMGQIPSVENMISTVITNPGNFKTAAKENQTFNVVVKMRNFEGGLFSDADLQYFSAPQRIDKRGYVKGHTHVVIYPMPGGFQLPNETPDPQVFSFFLGVKQPFNQDGEITVPITGGLLKGFYAVATMATAETHQGLTQPVAKHIPPDVTTYFEIS